MASSSVQPAAPTGNGSAASTMTPPVQPPRGGKPAGRRLHATRDGWQDFRRQGIPAVWSTGAMVLIILMLVAGMIGLVLSRGLGHFWPAAMVQVTTPDGTALGPVMEHEVEPAQRGGPAHDRILLKIGNRDVNGLDFKWFDTSSIQARTQPADAVVVERREHGDFHGYLRRLLRDEAVVADSAAAWDALGRQMSQARRETKVLNTIDTALEKLHAPAVRLEAQRDLARRRHTPDIGAFEARLETERHRTEARAAQLEAERDAQASRLAGRVAIFATADGAEKTLRLDTIVRAYRPNAMRLPAKVRHYAAKLAEFVFTGPRESNTEGGILPALFGTFLMVVLMTIVVVPLGVMAALYLHEYAKQGPVLRAVRLAVSNLAGVPSIVFGMFGLAFFVYGVGGFLDRTFFAASLPNPTFGTGGVLWASLTLSLLTLPVVIIATEEGLSSVPRANREGSLALGATQWQTLRHVVLPNALPGILTGLILAVSRGAGEVAPLMLTGVVKLAPDLAVDGTAPFIHLERKFMHLGFHIYDVSMQSPNVEAAKPMVYTTTLLLLVLVVALNATAIVMRNRMRRRYRGATL